MISHFWVYLATIVLGLAVLAWPDQDSQMLVTLSKRHGPSALDLVGLTLILVGYVPIVARVWTRRIALQFRFRTAWPLIIALLLASWAGIVAGLATEKELVLWTSVAASTLLQALLVVPAFLPAPANE